jgi:hypothetical protein
MYTFNNQESFFAKKIIKSHRKKSVGYTKTKLGLDTNFELGTS